VSAEAKPLFRPDVLRARLAAFALPPHVAEAASFGKPTHVGEPARFGQPALRPHPRRNRPRVANRPAADADFRARRA
jgi:hypothetical protein